MGAVSLLPPWGLQGRQGVLSQFAHLALLPEEIQEGLGAGCGSDRAFGTLGQYCAVDSPLTRNTRVPASKLPGRA